MSKNPSNNVYSPATRQYDGNLSLTEDSHKISYENLCIWCATKIKTYHYYVSPIIYHHS